MSQVHNTSIFIFLIRKNDNVAYLLCCKDNPVVHSHFTMDYIKNGIGWYPLYLSRPSIPLIPVVWVDVSFLLYHWGYQISLKGCLWWQYSSGWFSFVKLCTQNKFQVWRFGGSGYTLKFEIECYMIWFITYNQKKRFSHVYKYSQWFLSPHK